MSNYLLQKLFSEFQHELQYVVQAQSDTLLGTIMLKHLIYMV